MVTATRWRKSSLTAGKRWTTCLRELLTLVGHTLLTGRRCVHSSAVWRPESNLCSQNRKPGWWLVLADPKIGRIIVPPVKISDVPLANSSGSRDYRSYKVQFQAPPNVMTFSWKVYLVSDTYIGEEASQDVRVRTFSVHVCEVLC